MVETSIVPGKLALEVQGWHKLWALRSRLEIPLAHIKAVHADPHPAMGWFQGMKIAGTDMPHIFRAGLFWQEGGKVFWDVRHPENTIVLDLEDEGFTKLIIEVADVETTVREIRQAMADHRTAELAANREIDEILTGRQPDIPHCEDPTIQTLEQGRES